MPSTMMSAQYAVRGAPTPSELAAAVAVLQARLNAAAEEPAKPTRRGWPIRNWRRQRRAEES